MSLIYEVFFHELNFQTMIECWLTAGVTIENLMIAVWTADFSLRVDMQFVYFFPEKYGVPMCIPLSKFTSESDMRSYYIMEILQRHQNGETMFANARPTPDNRIPLLSEYAYNVVFSAVIDRSRLSAIISMIYIKKAPAAKHLQLGTALYAVCTRVTAAPHEFRNRLTERELVNLITMYDLTTPKDDDARSIIKNPKLNVTSFHAFAFPTASVFESDIPPPRTN
jgi:hypothetical protein